MTVDKISFITPDDERFSSFLDSLSDSEKEEARSIIDTYLSTLGDVSFAFAITRGALIVRAFDGVEYSFLFPYEICENADLGGAIEEAVRYAVLEEIEPIFQGVPSEYAELFFRLGYRHINADSDAPDSLSYRIALKNECSLLEDFPYNDADGLELSYIREEDISDYARLSRDDANNKYWGYDYKEDFPDCEDRFFLELRERDFESYSALSFAIRKGGKFVGEALISSFDYKGGADISIRILPEHQKKGYAGNALSLLFEIAEEIGLITLYARVFSENTPSAALFSKHADESFCDGEITVFVYHLYE